MDYNYGNIPNIFCLMGYRYTRVITRLEVIWFRY